MEFELSLSKKKSSYLLNSLFIYLAESISGGRLKFCLDPVQKILTLYLKYNKIV